MPKPHTHEALSALADGELGRFRARRLLSRLFGRRSRAARAATNDANDAGTDAICAWKRHHLVGSVLRGEYHDLPSAERVAQQVARALAEETAPRPEAASRRRLMMPAILRLLRALRALRAPRAVTVTAMLACAAGAFALWIVVGGVAVMPGDSDPQLPDQWHAARVLSPFGPSSPEPELEMARTINAFMVEHSEFAGINGLASYARFVGYDETTRP